MKENRNFARLTDNAIAYAPNAFTLNGVDYIHPTAEDFAQAGYLPVVEASPSDPPREGYHYAPDGLEARDGAIRRVWREEANPPPPPRRWTRLAIETALAQADMLDAMDAYLAQVVIVGKLTAARAFSRCDYIEEGYPNAESWSALLDGAAGALGKTREEIDAFLDAIPTEG